jgi:hypothetical protein
LYAIFCPIEYDWIPWKFRQVPEGYWHLDHHVTAYIEWLAEELKIENPLDWYRVSRDQLRELHGEYLLRTHGGLTKLLQTYYPGNSIFLIKLFLFLTNVCELYKIC